jgi:5,10-methylenetetrahydromethanopterin reductase
MAPDLGVLLYSDYTTRELVELGELSEALGYRYFWYTDVRFARECYLGLAAVAARTKRILLGTGVTDPYSRHPALTAAAIATLDEMSEGRAVLGLGTGGAGFKELGLERRLPVAAMRETVQIVRGLLGGGSATVEGKVVSISGGRLSFKPPRSAVPIHFATHGSQITKLCGQIADGVMIANTLVPEAFDFYIRHLDEGIAKAGRATADVDVGLRVEACIAEDDAAAFAVMRKRVATRVLAQYPHWDYLEELNITLPQAFVDLAAERKPGAAEQAAALFPAEAVPTMVVAGNAESAARQLARALGPRITQVTVRPHTVAGQGVGEVIRAFAEQVMPRALELRGTGAAAEAA